VIKNKMQQKMLSDQPLAAYSKAKRKRNKNDGFCAVGFVFLCRSLLAALP